MRHTVCPAVTASNGMKYSEIQSKPKIELENLVKDLRIRLGKARFNLSANTLKDTSQLGKIKKDIAKIMTALKKLT